jgi:outer membrane protein assembly factor BamD (BamD/ComL family)
MRRWSVCLVLIGFCLLACPLRSPAPLIYRPGEGWIYEPVGQEGKWQRPRAKDQLEVAQAAFDKEDYKLALKAARRVVRQWPLSDYSPHAQYLLGRCYEARRQDEKAFKEYQKVLEKHPKIANYEEVLQRQYEIANRFLAGQWFKLWGYIPFFPSMERTATMYEKIVQNGPYSDIGPKAQLKIGAAHELKKVLWFKTPEYLMSVKAYERAADRYHDRPQIAADALYKAGMAYYKQAKTAEYDQSAAGHAIATITDFITLHPKDPRVPEAQQVMSSLRTEQARGSFQIAKFYEGKGRWKGALIYYNEVLLQDPRSSYATTAQQRIDTLKNRIETASR